MVAQRYRMADAGSPMASPGGDGLLDHTQLTQRGWDVWTDFGAGALYDQARARAFTVSGTVAWDVSGGSPAVDFAAASANCSLTYPTFAPPSRYTVAVLFVVGTARLETVSTWVESSDANTYDRQIRITAGAKVEWYSFGGATIASTTTVTAGMLVHAVATYDGATHRLYINGRLENSGSSASGGYGGYGTPLIRLGYKSGHGTFNSGTHKILAFGVAPVAYDAGQVAELWQRPFGQVTPRRRTRASGAVLVEVSLTGAAATVGNGTLTAAVLPAITGIAATSGAGTTTASLAVSVSGSAMTLSAGSLAYTIAFTLTGEASTSAGGSLTASPVDTRTLTGIKMTALPGNVRVTGGTRWTPQAEQAAVIPSLVGNTLPPPPRLIGDPQADNRAIQQWLTTLYDRLVKEGNILGRVPDHERRIAALESPDDTTT